MVTAACNFCCCSGRSLYRSGEALTLPMIQMRTIGTAMVLCVVAAVGGSSASEGWLNLRGGFKPVPSRWWVESDKLLLWGDTWSNRQYALDALALKYVGEYTDDPEVEGDIRRGYWCATPVVQQMSKIPANERNEAALRERARAMVSRTTRTTHDPPSDAERLR